jgi:hypothetical protein
VNDSKDNNFRYALTGEYEDRLKAVLDPTKVVRTTLRMPDPSLMLTTEALVSGINL